MPIIKLPEKKLSVSELSLAAHMPTDALGRIIHSPHVKWLLEDPSFCGGLRFFAEEESVNLLAISDLTRAGITLPLAAGWLVSIREQLIFYPSAIAHVEFRRNGRTFAFVTDEAPDAAVAAGPARFRVTIDLAGYRTAFRETLDLRRPAERAA